MENVEKLEPLHTVGKCKMVQPLWNIIWVFLKKLKTELPYDPEIPLLGMYRKELKSGSQRDMCTPMFTAALFIIVKMWKQPECPSTDEWTRKYGIFIKQNTV